MLKTVKERAKHKKNFGKEGIKILYEDKYLAVIHKDEGLLSVPFPGSTKRTAIFLFEEEMKRRGDFSRYHRPFVVHRLDRDTSGVMVIALDGKTQRILMNTWQETVKRREYVALCENPHDRRAFPKVGTISAPLAYNAHNIGFVPLQNDRPNLNAERELKRGAYGEKSIYLRHLRREKGEVRFQTIDAVTHYKILAQGRSFTLFELSLETGRKNQIRAHLSFIGYKIAGDENYRARTDPFHRLCLHAKNLEFIHPHTKKLMTFEVKEPEEWCDAVKLF